MSLTPEQFEKKLNLLTDIDLILKDAPFVAMLDFQGKMEQRVFNNGISTNGTQIGEYSTKFSIKFKKKEFDRLNKLAQRRVASSVEKNILYKDLRVKAGRQVAYVDLEFTGKLRKSIVIEEKGGVAILRINDKERGEIAGDLTEKYKKAIFTPSELEAKEAKEFMFNFVKEEIQKIINSWR